MSDLETCNQPVWNFSDFNHLVPKTGWIRNYLAYAIKCTDAPPEYHIMSAISAVASAVSAQVDLIVFGEAHPLHMFLLIVGNSGTRKSAAIKRCLRIVRNAYQRVGLDRRVWWPESCSPEGIIDQLADDPNRLIIAGEWTELHNQSKASYWQHASEFWNLIYDAMPMQRVRAGQQISVNEPRVSVLGASTFSLVKNAVNIRDWMAGKMARYLICCAERPEDKYMDTSNDSPSEVGMLTLEFERFFTQATSPITLSKEAWDYFREWRQSPELAKQLVRFKIEHLEPSANRIDEHVLRLAAVYQASVSFPFQNTIDLATMSAAIHFVEHCMRTLAENFIALPILETTPFARVRAYLASVNGDVLRKTVLRHVQLTKPQLDAILEVMLESGELVRGADVHRNVFYTYQHRS